MKMTKFESILVHNMLHEQRIELYRKLAKGATNDVLVSKYNKTVSLLNKTTEYMVSKGEISTEYADIYDHWGE